MQLSTPVRLAVVIGAVLIVIAVVVGIIITGGELDASAILAGAGALLGGLLVGIGAAGGPSRGAGAAVLLLALCAPLAACSGDQSVDVGRCSSAVLRAAQDVATACWPRRSEADEAACPLESEAP